MGACSGKPSQVVARNPQPPQNQNAGLGTHGNNPLQQENNEVARGSQQNAGGPGGGGVGRWPSGGAAGRNTR